MHTAFLWLGIAGAAMFTMLAATSLLARFSDGPIGIFSGGSLVEGERFEESPADWVVYEDFSQLDLQLVEPPRSRRVWFLVDEGNLYIPSGYVRSMPLWKHWPREAAEDGRALLRIQGRIYPVQLVKVGDDNLRWKLARQLSEKYSLPVPDSSPDPEELWIFRADRRRHSGD